MTIAITQHDEVSPNLANPAKKPQPLRFACDRCHAQKLRCPRSTAVDKNGRPKSCLRCFKAQKPCILSLPNKVGRPPKAPKKKKAGAPTETCAATHPVSHRFSPGIDIRDGGDDGGDDDMFDFGHFLSPAQSVHNNNGALTPVSDFAIGIPSSAPAHSTAASVEEDDKDGEDEEDEEDEGDNGEHDGNLDQDMVTLSTQGQMQEDHSLGMDMYLFPLHDFPSFEHLDLEPSSGRMASVSDIGIAGHASMIGNIDGIGSLLNPAISTYPYHAQEPVCTQQSNARRPNISKTAGFSVAQRKRRTPTTDEASVPPRDDSPPRRLSSTTSLQTLTDLNMKILRLSEKSKMATNHASGSKATTGHVNQVVSEMVQFSGELIDIVPRIMLRSSSTGAFIAEDDWASHEIESKGHAVPECTAIFLLMGCYTQIMCAFQSIINYLYQHHYPAASSPNSNNNHPSLGSLLEASLNVHTITYLLSRLNRALCIHQPESPELHDMLHDYEYDPRASSQGRSAHIFGKTASGGLVGRAICDMNEREQCLVRKIRELKRIVNGSRGL